MKRKSAILFISLALVSVCATACWWNKEPEPINIYPVSGDNSGDAASKILIKPIRVENFTDNIAIDNRYPSITNFKNKSFETHINDEISKNISEYRSEISKILDDKTPPEKHYVYTTNYDKYEWGKYLTLVINQTYDTGGIRTNTWKDMYNINTETERLIEIDELFKPTFDYEEAIIEEIANQATEKNYVLMNGDGLKKLLSNQKFYIKEGVLVIYFDPMEIAANKYGALEFEMPFALNEDGFFEAK